MRRKNFLTLAGNMAARLFSPFEFSMDLAETIRQLMLQRERIVDAIAVLEKLQNDAGGDPGVVVQRRGRKSMPQEERRNVCKQTKRYWADRRQRPPE